MPGLGMFCQRRDTLLTPLTGGDWIESDEVARYKTAENEWEVLDYKMKIPREHFSVVSTPYTTADEE